MLIHMLLRVYFLLALVVAGVVRVRAGFGLLALSTHLLVGLSFFFHYPLVAVVDALAQSLAVDVLELIVVLGELLVLLEEIRQVFEGHYVALEAVQSPGHDVSFALVRPAAA